MRPWDWRRTARQKQPSRIDDYTEGYRQSISFPDGIRKRCSGPSMPSSRRRAEGSKAGYLSIGQFEIVHYKANAEAVLRARLAENNNHQTWSPLGL